MMSGRLTYNHIEQLVTGSSLRRGITHYRFPIISTGSGLESGRGGASSNVLCVGIAVKKVIKIVLIKIATTKSNLEPRVAIDFIMNHADAIAI